MLQGSGRESEGCEVGARSRRFPTVRGTVGLTPLAARTVTFVQNNQWPLCCLYAVVGCSQVKPLQICPCQLEAQRSHQQLLD